MSLISKIHYKWHIMRKNYHQLLLDSCLDYNLKNKITKKITYHDEKIKQLNSF
ncbi:hypothetical protein FB550_108198 [Neobacillus bataviensis]|uniref:Uncharacterized protein n=1 Tax=Neobacillus bataviensis TaxID=220685 RepID=A0A561D669_9BACI|nr:hypothetical protein FB550_108198 [Neobacillus bataviensis]